MSKTFTAMAGRSAGAAAPKRRSVAAESRCMSSLEADANLIRITGESPRLVDLLREPLRWALGDRRCFYDVSVDSVGRVGEVLVSITGSRGHLPLFFGANELEPGYVSRVVRDTVSRYGL